MFFDNAFIQTGICQSCGKQTFLIGTVTEKKDGSGLQFIMCCFKCREIYKKERLKQKHKENLKITVL